MALGGSVLVLLVTVSQCGLGFAALPSTFPTAYPGMPSGDYSPQWQTCGYAAPYDSPKF